MDNHFTEPDIVGSYIDRNLEDYGRVLRQAVGIQSVFTRGDNLKLMIHWAAKTFRSLGASVEKCYYSGTNNVLRNGGRTEYPPILLVTLGKDPMKNQVCIYCHLDVEPAEGKEGWTSEPFTLSECSKYFHGRGTSDNKGPLACWIYAIKAFQESKLPIPINLKFCLDSMGITDVRPLTNLLIERRNTFLKDVDFFLVANSYGPVRDVPSVSYGVRGMVEFYIDIESTSKNLPSGAHGGVLNEAASDMIYMLDSLKDAEGFKNTTGVSKKYKSHPYFKTCDFRRDIGHSLLDAGVEDDTNLNDTESLLMKVWANTSLSIHGIEGFPKDPESHLKMPPRIIGKFSVHLVPRQTPYILRKYILGYLLEKWDERGSTNRLKLGMTKWARPWHTDPKADLYDAVRRAFKIVFDSEPNHILGANSIPFVPLVSRLTHKKVILISLSGFLDYPSGVDEKFLKTRCIKGPKLFAALMHELAKIPTRKVVRSVPHKQVVPKSKKAA